jgi:hypothetical protein
LKLLHEQIAAFKGRYHLKSLLPELPRLYFSAADSLPPTARRRVLKTVTGRIIHTLAFGSFVADEQILAGRKGGSPRHSEALRRLVPPRCRYGYDLIVFCGLELYLHGRQVAEIQSRIQQQGAVEIAASTVQMLAYKFLKYLGRLHRHSVPAIRHQMALAGGYILHLDATCEEKDPLLLSCLDGRSAQVLYAKKIRSENQVDLKKILHTIKALFGRPLAAVTDMGRAFLTVIAEIFPGLAHVICHYHFLRDVGKDFLGKDYETLRGALRKQQIKAVLRSCAKNLAQKLGGAEKITTVLERPNCQAYFNQAKAQELLRWYALQAIYEIQFTGHSGDGYGFPFDRPQVDYYEKLETAATQIRGVLQDAATLSRRDKKDLLKLESVLRTVVNDHHLQDTVKALREKMAIFDRLRQIMRLTKKNGTQGLNDNGALAGQRELKTIEKELKAYTTTLAKRTGRPGFNKRRPQLATGIKRMVKQIRFYWQKLFMSPVIVQVDGRRQEIIAQRTNNIMERSFRQLKRRCRRRHGRKKLQKDLEKLPAEIALVENLQNEQYLATVIGGLDKLPEKFAELDRQKSLTLKAMKSTDSSAFSKMIFKQLQLNDVKTLVTNRLQTGKI